VRDPAGPIAAAYRSAARHMAAALGRSVREQGQAGPEIVIEE
jgi:hypothetical protein